MVISEAQKNTAEHWSLYVSDAQKTSITQIITYIIMDSKMGQNKMTKFLTHGQVSNNVVPTCCLRFCCRLKQTERKMFLECLRNWKLTIPCRSPPLGGPSWNETVNERKEVLILWFWQLFLFTHTHRAMLHTNIPDLMHQMFIKNSTSLWMQYINHSCFTHNQLCIMQ